MAKIMANSFTRLDLGGGTLDIWPLYLFFPEVQVINTTINIITQAEIREDDKLNGIKFISNDLNLQMGYQDAKNSNGLTFHRRLAEYFEIIDHPIIFETNSQAPLGSGLGGSSSLLVSMVRALTKYLCQEKTDNEIMRIAQDIETSIIGVPTGTQDYIAALNQGFLRIKYKTNQIKIESISISLEFKKKLQERLYLLYTGESHHSASENWQIFQNCINKDSKTIEIFNIILDITNMIAVALENERIDNLIKFIVEEWNHRKQLLPSMETEVMRNIMGELGSKFQYKGCGAAGGGTMMIFGPPGQRNKIENVADKYSAKILNYEFS